MQYLEYAAPLFFTICGFVGVTIWARAIQEYTQGRMPLPARAAEPATWDVWAVLAALFIWAVVDAAVGSMWRLSAETGFVERLQAITASGFAKTGLTMLTLAAMAGVSWRYFVPGAGQWWTDTWAGTWGFFASLPAVWFVSLLIERLRTAENGHPFIRALQEHPDVAAIAWVAVAVLLAAPLCEELLFRVILQGWLHERVSPPAAIFGVAAAFAAVHINAWPDPLPLIPLSLILGYVYYRRRSYYANVLMHALFNGMNLLMALYGGQ